MLENPPPLRLDALRAADVTSGVLAELESLYATAYHGSHMYVDLIADLQERPTIFRLFLIRDTSDDGRVVAARVIESKRHAAFDYLGFPPIHGKRFCVSPTHRGRRIGTWLIDAAKAYVFGELGLSVIFGESNEVGALALHGREGALYRVDSIADAFRRNSQSEAITLFGRILDDPKLRTLRLPVGAGVQFVYCAEDRPERLFRENGYVARRQLRNE